MLDDSAFTTDKVRQGYTSTYRRLADELGPTANMCEIGVYKGEAFPLWRDLFPQGVIAGVDISAYATWPDYAVKIVASQDDASLPDQLREHAAEWGLIVDDGSHDGTLTAKTFDLLWPLVPPGGYYVIEDWFVGFADYYGACKSPEMMPVVSSLLQRLHWQTDTDSVYYRYGMAVIKKCGSSS